ncbi:hypothetical protein, partial [Saccharothrix coeruleofusca]
PAPLPPFPPQPITNGGYGGVDPAHKVHAMHNVAVSDPFSTAQQTMRHVYYDLLPQVPQPAQHGLYAVLAQAAGQTPAGLRGNVVAGALGQTTVLTEVARHTVQRPAHNGHLYNALVEQRHWTPGRDAAEDAGWRNARDLTARLIATELRAVVELHEPGRPVAELGPFSGQATQRIRLRAVLVITPVTHPDGTVEQRQVVGYETF